MADRLDWWIEQAKWLADFVVDNWKTLLAISVAFGLGAGTSAVISPTLEPIAVETCPETIVCPEPQEVLDSCIQRMDRCLVWMSDMPEKEE